MAWSTLLLILPLCVQAAYLLPRSPQTPSPPAPRYPIKQIGQFPNPTWIENLAVRSNGHLLLTLFNTPALYTLNPFLANATPQLVATFPAALGIMGITELSGSGSGAETFAITAGNLSETGIPDLASFSIWKVNLNPPHGTGTGSGGASISKIVDVSSAVILNGLTTVGKDKKVLIAADSIGGVLFRVDLTTKNPKVEVALNTSATQPGEPYPLGWGVNGVHFRENQLYFTNTDKGLYRVPVGEDGKLKEGEVKLVSGFLGADDFDFGIKGDKEILLANGGGGFVQKVNTATGEVVKVEVEVAGGKDNELLLLGITSVALGRAERDKKTLYAVTNGGWSGVPEGVQQVGGRVLAIDLGK